MSVWQCAVCDANLVFERVEHMDPGQPPGDVYRCPEGEGHSWLISYAELD